MHLGESFPSYIGVQRLESKESLDSGKRLSSIGSLVGAIERKEDVIDGAIGADSPFHGTFGYHADGVSPETARLPLHLGAGKAIAAWGVVRSRR